MSSFFSANQVSFVNFLSGIYKFLVMKDLFNFRMTNNLFSKF